MYLFTDICSICRFLSIVDVFSVFPNGPVNMRSISYTHDHKLLKKNRYKEQHEYGKLGVIEEQPTLCYLMDRNHTGLNVFQCLLISSSKAFIFSRTLLCFKYICQVLFFYG